MIIMGYPGIGKSTVAKDDYRFIDLDSGHPLLRGRLFEKNWERRYCDVAAYLSKQGYFVFVSTHPAVVKLCIASGELCAICYPSKELKEDWVTRLYKRYDENRCRATHDAWVRARGHFEEDVEHMKETPCTRIELLSIDYNLKKNIVLVYTGLKERSNKNEIISA